MTKKTYPLPKASGLLEPAPVVMVSTIGKSGANIMTMSCHTMMDFEPPNVGCIISNRNFSFDILRKTKECVLNIPTVELAEQVVAVGNSRGEKLDKFAAFGLTPTKARQVTSRHR